MIEPVVVMWSRFQPISCQCDDIMLLGCTTDGRRIEYGLNEAYALLNEAYSWQWRSTILLRQLDHFKLGHAVVGVVPVEIHSSMFWNNEGLIDPNLWNNPASSLQTAPPYFGWIDIYKDTS